MSGVAPPTELQPLSSLLISNKYVALHSHLLILITRLRELRLQHGVRRRRHLRPRHRAVRLPRGCHWPELRPLSSQLGARRQ